MFRTSDALHRGAHMNRFAAAVFPFSDRSVRRPLAPSRRRFGCDTVVGLACALALPIALLFA